MKALRLVVLFVLAIPAVASGNKDKDLLDAAHRGDIPAVRAALSAGADVETRDKNGRTPLILAAELGNVDMLRLLLEKGAKPDSRGKNGFTAYGTALLLPPGQREKVLPVLPKPPLLRLAAESAWLPESMASSCYLSRPELAENIDKLHLDAVVVGAFADYARLKGKDVVEVVRAEAEGARTSAAEMDASETGVDAVVELAVRPGRVLLGPVG